MSDEERFVQEWTDYHLGIGFSHIYIYDTSPNRTFQTWAQSPRSGINELATGGAVQVVHRVPEDGQNPQTSAYDVCMDKTKNLTHPPIWVLFIDGDEFLQHVPSGALHINWLIFGTGNQTHYRDEPVTSRFRWRLPQIDILTKTVVVLEDAVSMDVHFATLKEGAPRKAMGRGVFMRAGPPCCVKVRSDTSVAAIHHYKFKSMEEWYNKTCLRGMLNPNRGQFMKCNKPTEPGKVYDDSAWKIMLRNVPKYAVYDNNQTLTA